MASALICTGDLRAVWPSDSAKCRLDGSVQAAKSEPWGVLSTRVAGKSKQQHFSPSLFRYCQGKGGRKPSVGAWPLSADRRPHSSCGLQGSAENDVLAQH